ncbi:hypothetical protein QE152_g8973 [Popillia japonica]|uniref:Uncharacterized protein n=1 Tax=Popillia japonica TaxID=7064 RepID=A0AAW1M0R6_POPJA
MDVLDPVAVGPRASTLAIIVSGPPGCPAYSGEIRKVLRGRRTVADVTHVVNVIPVKDARLIPERLGKYFGDVGEVCRRWLMCNLGRKSLQFVYGV